jgi:sugar phosphate isomerase/epimerase
MITRRGLLMSAAAAASLRAKPFTTPVGVQLYTVRKQIPDDADGTLKAISEIGYKEIECSRADLPRLTPLFKKYNLTPIACHMETPLITGAWKNAKEIGWSEAIDSMKAAGMEYAVMAYVAPADRGTGDFYKELADKMNAAAERCHKAGLKFAYHNHAFEFAGKAPDRPIDTMLGRLDFKLVGLEVDVFWVSVAGNDPLEFLKTNKGRVPLLHLKDKMRGLPAQYSESVKPETFQEVGSGSLDFAAILRTARSIGVKHYFVEQDQTPGDPVASLRKSYEYLRKVQL